jgi:hypothetical protein
VSLFERQSVTTHGTMMARLKQYLSPNFDGNGGAITWHDRSQVVTFYHG